MTADSASRCLDLARSQLSTGDGLQSKLAETHLVPAIRQTAIARLLLFAELRSFGL
jgi:hypothetical protein